MRLVMRASILLVCIILAAGSLFRVSAFTPHHRRSSIPSSSSSLSKYENRSEDSPCIISDLSHSVWMCISTVLVLGMSPALALFEAGMLRSKSTVSLISQIFAGVITLSTLWLAFGYTLTFGESFGGIIGGFEHTFFIGVSYDQCSKHAPVIPEALFATFQMMFAVITPLLMTGAFAERLKFKAFIFFIVGWEMLVYYPIAHMLWGGGFLGTLGVLDFAGGIVIHTTAGVGALVSALYLGRRKHFFDFMGEFPPSNLPLAATGAALLWIGWFGFNGGSALEAGPVVVTAIVNTQIGCSVGAFTWLVLSWWKGKPQSCAIMNGCLAGMAGITPAAGYINSSEALILAIVLGAASFYAVHLTKHRWHIDDALDVSSVHGLTGVIGSVAIGLFAQRSINAGGNNGLFYGNGMQLVYQLIGVLVAAVWAGLISWVLLIVLDHTLEGGVRVSIDEEEIGLDWSEHCEVAYHKLHVLDEDSGINVEHDVHWAPEEGAAARATLSPRHQSHSPPASQPVVPIANGSYGSNDSRVPLVRQASLQRQNSLRALKVPSVHEYKRTSPEPPLQAV